ncbi:MAG: DNA polymerase IV [Atopobiaceae bacterium]|nr:DNA polymerase IV [Atopobiaceae bacterium]
MEDVSLDIPWEGRAIALLDLDAFFASVEQLDHPEWRGKPVIVGGSAERRGVVSTASYEARVYGVHSAMPSWQAKRLCPQAIWTHGHYKRYQELSHQVMQIVGQETPLVEQVSIDEAFFDVSPGRFSRENPIDICRRIQARVADLGITCSIGLGTNKTVAKIASERQKPRGLTVVLPGTEASFLAPLPVRAMSGIGKATESRLQELGIRTLGQLAKQDEKRMQAIFGVSGPRMVMRAAGREDSAVSAVDAPDEIKSVSNERTFAHDLTTREELEAAIDHVSALVGTRLRKKSLAGTQVTLKLKFDIMHTHTAQRQLASPTDDEHVFGAVARELLGSLWVEGTGVRLVGVAISGFDGARPQQLGLFEQEDTTDAKGGRTRDLRALSVATDNIRKRFGNEALSYGRELRFRDNESDTAPMDKRDY